MKFVPEMLVFDRQKATKPAWLLAYVVAGLWDAVLWKCRVLVDGVPVVVFARQRPGLGLTATDTLVLMM